MLLAGAAPPAAGAPSDATCPAPFGTALEAGAHRFLGNVTDADGGLLDTLLMPGAQRTPATVVAFGGRLALVAEVKVDQGPSFTWGVLVRFYSNDTGWNSAPVWLSSADTAVAYPVGFHVRPTAALWGGSLFVAWTGEGSPAGGPADRIVLVRRVAQDGTVTPWLNGSDTDPRRANQHPFLLPAGDTLYLAYAAGEGEADPAATHIQVRAFDGVAFVASEEITRPPAGWSDELPALAWDGAEAVFAVWTRTNTSGLGAKLMFSARNATAWGPEFEVAPLGHAASANPAAAFFEGRLLVAYATDDATEIVGPDADVRWRSFDPSTAEWSGPSSVNPQPSSGEDSSPAFSLVGGTLYFGWSTTDDFYSHGSDADPVYRPFEGGALGATVEVAAADDNSSDGPPHVLELAGVTYAHFAWTPPVEPGQPRGDTREAIRVLSRPAAWFDGLAAVYTFEAASENGSTRVAVTPAASVPESARLTLRLADGSLYPLAREGGKHVAWAPVEPARPDFDVLACGAPIALTPGAHATPPAGTDWTLLAAAAAVGALAVGAYLVARGPRRRGPPPA